METIKNVIASATGQNFQESGEEPVSGQQGAGSATSPYDAGNQDVQPDSGDKIPQHVNTVSKSDELSGQEPVSGQQGEGTATQPFDAGNREDNSDLGGKAPQHTTSGDVTPVPDTSQHRQVSPSQPQTADSKSAPLSENSVSETKRNAQDPPKLTKKPTIGSSSWFTNVNPFAKQDNSTEQSSNHLPDTQGEQLTDKEHQSGPTPKATPRLSPDRPGENVSREQDSVVVEPVVDHAFTRQGNLPNHLGNDVPPGQTDGFERSKGKGKGKMVVGDNLDHHREFSGVTESSSAASNRSERLRPESMATDYTYATAGTDASTIASSSRRSSTTTNIPHSKGKPITAGGVPLGLRAMQDRERRLSSAPIYEHPEQNLSSRHNVDAYAKSASTLPKMQEEVEPTSPETPSTAIRSGKRYDSAGVGDRGEKQSGNEATPRRRSSVIQKARSFGRKVRHSIGS